MYLDHVRVEANAMVQEAQKDAVAVQRSTTE